MAIFKGWPVKTLFIALGFAAGIGGTFYYFSLNDPLVVFNSDCVKQYPLTNHGLDCDTYNDSSAKLHDLNQKLKDSTDLYVSEGKATRISVWVRDLATLQWASTNDTQRFAPASLLKLPLMIAYYKVGEIEPSLLDTKLTYATSSMLNSDSQDFMPANPLVAGRSYTVRELIEHMIIDSDNNATALLLSHIDQTIFEKTLIDLGIKIPGNTQNYDFITAKSYGAIFRTLYNASYLNREYSQQALSLLSKSSFKGIAQPLPASVTVAHKFGEREITDSGGNVTGRELHDCGIIYKDSKPYSFCIMSEGANFADLENVIQDISLLTFDNL